MRTCLFWSQGSVSAVSLDSVCCFITDHSLSHPSLFTFLREPSEGFGGQPPAGVYTENRCRNGSTVRLGHRLWGQSEGSRTCAVSAMGSHLLHEPWSHPDNAGRGGCSSETLLETEELRRSHIQARSLHRNAAWTQCKCLLLTHFQAAKMLSPLVPPAAF